MGVGDIKNELYEGFMKEITEGIGKSGIKPGAIKIATGANIFSECEEILLAAAGQSSKETGIPIITHTEDGTMGHDQAKRLLNEGVNPARVMIGHMCGNPSIGYQCSVLDKKVSIAFDRFGLEYIRSDEARLKTLLELLKRGFAGQIMLSHDRIACAPGRGGLVSENIGRKLVNWSFTNIFKNIIPALKSSGITDDQINMMMINNPRRLFGGE
jgi:phosphotriesterase-related protein